MSATARSLPQQCTPFSPLLDATAAQAHVDLEKGLATVSVEAGDAATAAAALAKAVQELGFDAAPQA